MKFKALPVLSLEDATVDFEQLSTKDILNLTAESVLQLSATGTARAIGLGTGTFTAPATQLTVPVSVNHGLPRTPIFAMAFSTPASGETAWYASDFTFSSTQVSFVGVYPFGTGFPNGFVQNFIWAAIG